MSLTEISILIIIGIAAGFLSGTLGIGGAIIIVPALVFIMGLSQHQAQGTSLAVLLLPTGFLAVLNYYKAGFVNIRYVAIIVIAFVVGSYFGSLLSISMSGRLLRVIFGVITLLMSLKLIFSK